MSYQDWKPVVIGKSTQRKTGHSAEDIREDRRKGKDVAVEKKYGGGGNRQTGVDGNLKKIDEETEEFHVSTVSLSLRNAIQKARQAKNWNQKQLAQAINEKASVINEYESGKAIPNSAVISKLERALGVKLPRNKKK